MPPKASVLPKEKISGLSLPLDVTVSAVDSRRPTQIFRPHVFAGVMPDRCLVNIDNELLVASPEFCFFQMANEIPLVKLIELGYELCGSYSLPAFGTADEDFAVEAVESADEDLVAEAADEDFTAKAADKDTAFNVEPLTRKKRLEAFVSQMTGKHGRKRAARALRYIADGSASPMETILAILLVLPNNLGGYGFPLPEMNRKIESKPTTSGYLGKQFYKCDLFWKGSAVAAEYDSDLYHSGFEKISDDSIRKIDLSLSGINVVTVTNKQIHSIEEFDKVARTIASKMGRRIQIRNSEFAAERHKLRSFLFNRI